MGGSRDNDAVKVARARRAQWPGSSFLTGLEEPVLCDFLAAGELVRFRNRQVLLTEGDTTSDVFLLLDAFVKVTAQLDSGGQALLAIRVGGDIVGEIAFMDGGDRTATVSACAHEPVSAVRLGRDTLRDLLGHYPDASLSLMAAIGHKLRTATRRRVDITGCPPRVRMARAVLELAEDYGRPVAWAPGTSIGVNLTQIELGTLIGVGKSTAERALRSLKKDGLVGNAQQRRLVVPDMEALRAAAWPS